MIKIGKAQKEELFFREITSMSHKYAAHVDFSQSELATFKEWPQDGLSFMTNY